MKKLSSDFLFYIRSTWSIIAPVLIVVFIRLIPFRGLPVFIIPIVSFIMAVLVIYQIYYVSKFRQVIYHDKSLIITNYFTKNSIEIPVSDAISLVKKPGIQTVRIKNLSYKLTYSCNNKKKTIYFLKSLEFYNIDNIAMLIGIGTYIEAGPENYIENMNTRIAASFKMNVEARFTSAIMDWGIMTIVMMPFALPNIISISILMAIALMGCPGIYFLLALLYFFVRIAFMGKASAKE